MKAALVLPLLLAACVAEPRLNAGISIGTGGVSVYPSVSGRVGPARVAISP
ncbi:MAG: hypothetical protein ACK4S2_02180 [Gemmobacter sp.]|uniref:hypothetical protein n=1 Tax=Gemmobacter sp. TaxID=1898957 RepID=UPI00391A5B7C